MTSRVRRLAVGGRKNLVPPRTSGSFQSRSTDVVEIRLKVIGRLRCTKHLTELCQCIPFLVYYTLGLLFTERERMGGNSEKPFGVNRLRAGRKTSFERLEQRQLLTVVTFDAPSSNSGDGTWVLEQREGIDVHVGPAYLYYNTSPAAFPGFQVGDTMFVKVNYYDEGSGTIRVQYDSVSENFDQTEFHTRSSRVDTQEFVSSFHYLDNVQLGNGTNGRDFRVVTNGVPIASVELSDEPFANSGLDWVWSPPWESPYAGVSRDVDASTLQGKVLAGYQGWFNTPNDAADEGYVHWGQPGNWSIEQWPDVNDYDSTEVFAVPGVTTASGEQAYLFSSANSSVVNRHFQWMREHDIDGVLVQRFTPSFMFKQPDGSYVGEPQWPVTNARDAAHREGRTWAIEYDIQNGGTEAQRWERVQQVKDDWEFLTDTNRMDILNDSHYQREDGKPVVAIFGLYVSGGNSYTTAQQTDLLNYFKSRGVYVVGAGRHTESSAQIANAGMHDAYIPWQGYWRGGDSYASDEIRLNGVTDHIPHIFPGFSWTHLQNDDTATSRDREDGNFYWRMISDAANQTDAPWYFIGMFDEYDEGTNIIPASDDPPVPDTDAQGDPLTYQISDPRPNDWWMALTGVAKQALQDKISINDTIPTEVELENRSNVGGEAVWQASGNERLTSVDNPDGQTQTMMFSVDGNAFDAIYSTDDFLYFAVDDSFLSQEADGRDVTIEVEYLDSGTGQFGLQYDGTAAFYAVGGSAALTDSGTWRTHRFDVSDAYFGNNQNGDTDFRLEKVGGNLFVRRVRVVKERMLTVHADLGTTNTSIGLEQVELAGDGQTTATTNDGRSVRQLSGAATSLYIYMRVDNDFANAVQAGLNAVVEVVYRDVGSGNLNVQYDSTGAPYRNANSVALENSGEWRTARFYLDDALFANRQNGMSDFRITGNNIPIDSVRVLHSFGDLVAPTLESALATVNPTQPTVSVTWSMTDDWKTGLMDQWTQQEDNHVRIEWTNDGGSNWNELDHAYEGFSAFSQSGYDASAGHSTWDDQYIWDTSSLPAGTYQLRLTPADGRGNIGQSLLTASFDVESPSGLPGDYNSDGTVNDDDLTMWSAEYSTSVSPGTGADGSENGLVDGADFLLWQRNFGASSVIALEGIESAPVPAAQFSGADNLSTVDWAETETGDRVVAVDAGFAMFSTNSPTRKGTDLEAETERTPSVAYADVVLPQQIIEALLLREESVDLLIEAEDSIFTEDDLLTALLNGFEGQL